MISNTFSGFGSMTVRNTNIVTMSSFIVMIQCMFHEKRSEENRNTIIYVIMKKTSSIFNIFRDFSSGSVGRWAGSFSQSEVLSYLYLPSSFKLFSCSYFFSSSNWQRKCFRSDR